MIIDTHGHVFPRDYIKQLSEVNPSARRAAAPAALDQGADVDRLLLAMEEAGIGHSVVGVGSHQPWTPNAADSVRLASLGNDGLAELVARGNGRLSGYGCLPLIDPRAAIDEAERCVHELGFIGFTIGTHMSGSTLDDPGFEPVWEALNDLAAVVQIHPVAGQHDDYNLGPAIHGPNQVCVAAARLALSGLTTRHNRLKIIATCLGGGIPFLLHRINQFFTAPPGGMPAPDSDVDAERALRSLYFDTEYGTGAALRCTRDAVGIDRIVFGTNYPFADLRMDVANVLSSGISTEESTQILARNPRALLGSLRPV